MGEKMKLIFGILSLATLMISNPFVINENEVEKVIITSIGDYELCYEDKYILYYQNHLFQTFDQGAEIKMVAHLNHIVVFQYYEHKIKLFVWDHYQRLIASNLLYDEFVSNFQVRVLNGKLLLVGGINGYHSEELKAAKKPYLDQIDACIIVFDDSFEVDKAYTYGGIYNEYFIDIKTDYNNYYLIGKKDTLSGGDFGYGGGHNGGYMIVALNQEFTILNYHIIRAQTFVSWDILDNISIITNDTWYALSSDLTLLQTKEFNFSCYFGYFSDNGYLLAMSNETAYIFDRFTYGLLDDIDIMSEAMIIGENEIYRIKDGLITSINIFDMRYFKTVVRNPQENNMIRSVIGDFNLQNTIIEPFYDPIVYGTYHITYDYGFFSTNGTIEIPLESNLIENAIYPLGYALFFTGIGYLNGEKIVNNYKVLATGAHTLSLYGASGEKKDITFFVDAHQIKFEDPRYRKTDFEVIQNQTFSLKWKVDNPNHYPIESISLNGTKITDFTYDEGLITYTTTLHQPGTYTFVIDAIQYAHQERSIQLVNGHEFIIGVLKKPPTINATLLETKNSVIYHAQIADYEQTLRGLYIRLIDNQERQINYSLKNVTLIADDLVIHKKYEIVVGFLYNQGANLQEIELIRLIHIPHSTSEAIGDLEIVRLGESIEEIRINIRKNQALKAIVDHQQTIYTYEHFSILQPIIICTFIGFFITSCIIAIRWRFFRKAKQKPR